MKIVATYNVKGGVGKTSAAVNLAALAARDGLRTLLWDLDPQGSATFLLRVRPKVRGGANKLLRGRSEIAKLVKGSDIEGLDLLPADFSYRHMDLELNDRKRPTTRLAKVLRPVADHYDLVVLDCPPSISLVSESVFEAADALLVPLIPTTLSVRSFEQLLDFVEAGVDHQPEVIAFFSMVDRRKRLHRELVADLPAVHRGIISTAIPTASDIERMGVHRTPLITSAPHSAAAKAYAALWGEIRDRLGLSAASGRDPS